MRVVLQGDAVGLVRRVVHESAQHAKRLALREQRGTDSVGELNGERLGLLVEVGHGARELTGQDRRHGSDGQPFADRGGPVLGICNGFQILLESGLLPGAMLRNKGLKYRCEHVCLRVEQTDTPFTGAATAGQVLKIPIGHGEGNYFAPPEMLAQIEAHRQVILRYTDPQGRVDEAWNPNGSVDAIAALCNQKRNVVGMMPHPERACEALLGGVDGRVIFDSIVRSPQGFALQGVHA